MNQDGLILIKLSACFLALFALAEVIFHILKTPAEFTRKIVHIGTGVLTLTFPMFLQHLWQVVVICLSFLLLLGLSKKFNFLRSINAIDRPSSGSILYPIIVIITFAYYQYQQQQPTVFGKLLYFYLPILIMAVCDPLAALAGTAYKKQRSHTAGKTLAGSLTFFISAAMLSFSLYWSYRSGLGIVWLLLNALGVSLLTMIAERYSNGGWDNFTIPLAAIIFLTIIEATH